MTNTESGFVVLFAPPAAGLLSVETEWLECLIPWHLHCELRSTGFVRWLLGVSSWEPDLATYCLSFSFGKCGCKLSRFFFFFFYDSSSLHLLWLQTQSLKVRILTLLPSPDKLACRLRALVAEPAERCLSHGAIVSSHLAFYKLQPSTSGVSPCRHFPVSLGKLPSVRFPLHRTNLISHHSFPPPLPPHF